MARTLLTALIVTGMFAGTALAQPTFGRPKRDRNADEPAFVPDRGPEDDMGEAGPDEQAAGEFVPSPDEWAEGDPPRKAPAPDVEAGKTYAWRSIDGLRYAYTIPVDFKPRQGHDIVVICHPANTDFRWGAANSPQNSDAGSARKFRPNDIIVSPDGPSCVPGRPELRTFPATGAAAVRFRDFLLEISRVMPGKRILLYGHGGGGEPELGGAGGQFVTYFAGSFPALADGVVAYGAGLPGGAYEVSRSSVPIVYAHGVRNSIVPFSASLAAVDAHQAAGNRLVRLRALRSFNDYPNPVRVSETLDWLIGVRTDKPEECLAMAESLLRPKGVDEYDYSAPVWYAGARELLGRLLSEPGPLTGENPLEDRSAPSEAIKARARELIAMIDEEAAKHVTRLRQLLPEGTSAGSLPLDGRPWLGHLIAARDDFRGVGAMEAFAEAIGFDAAYQNHEILAQDLIAGWEERDEAENFRAVVETLPSCYLYEGLPVRLVSSMKVWRRKGQGAEIELDAQALEGFENVTNWDEGYRSGLDEYQKIWRRWRFEPPEQR